MTRYVALLRGINIGPHRRVVMADLRALMVGLGYDDVQTLLQSGNPVLTAKGTPERVALDLEHHIATDLGVKTEVVVRTGRELADVVERGVSAVGVMPRRTASGARVT